MNAERVFRHLVTGALTLLIGSTSTAVAQTLDRSAAILIFPYIRIETEVGVDTILSLSNETDAPVTARCFYIDGTNRCFNAPGTACTGTEDCGIFGPCVDFAFSALPTPFTVRLTAGQPLGWRLSQGRSLFPCDPPSECPGGSNAQSSIPPAPGGPFIGALQCVVVDDALRPVDTNALRGTATIEQVALQPPFIDVASYSAVGLRAISGAVNGSEGLVLGGPVPEYEGCPNVSVFEHLFDGAEDDMATPTAVSTQLALFPCSADYALGARTEIGVSYLVFNEFEQRFLTTVRMRGPTIRWLSSIDTSQPTRSIFYAGLMGTMSGQTRMQGLEAGVVAAAVEWHQPLDISSPPRTAAFNVHFSGIRSAADLVLLAVPQCPGDCDGNGQVDPTDLDRITNRFNQCPTVCETLTGMPGPSAQGCSFAFNQVLTQCYAADTNGDSCITAGEVARIVDGVVTHPPSGCPPTP